MEGLINKMKGIYKDPNRVLFPKSGSSPPSGVGSHSTNGSVAASILLKKRLTLPFLAFLAALTLGLLFLLPGSPLHAQEAMTELDHAENSTDPVATFTAVDPEGRTVYWSLLDSHVGIMVDGTPLIEGDVADYGDFNISMDGVLTFKSPPSFESLNGGQLEDVEATPGSNTYKVVVVSSDDAPGAGTTDTPIQPAYHKVTVNVTDEDEDGSVSLSALQPQQGVNLTATLMDDDAPDSDPDTSGKQIDTVWKWEQSSAMVGPWTLISGATAASYMPAKDVAGMYLRVTATYDDEHGDDKTAMAVSAHTSRAVPAGANSLPVFPTPAVGRSVDENSPPGTKVGKPVTAGDAGDVLTYTLSGTDDDPFYRIDPATGQITVGPRTVLNLEESGFEGTHTVTVTATDPAGVPGTPVTKGVTITVNNVNEAPTVTAGVTKNEHQENMTDDDTATDVNETVFISTYTVMDVDANDTIRWSLMGADKDAFEFDPPTPPTPPDADATDGVTNNLVFKKSPNYEKPTDADKDNDYMVTVVATDKKKLTAMRDVVITVKNADDEGEITFSSVRPRVRVPFAATLTDEDGAKEGTVKWQWYNDDPDDTTPGTLDTDASDDAIAKATSDTYTPKPADVTDEGVTLHVWVTYTDSFGPTSSTGGSANAVEDNRANQAPQFKLGDKVITSATRSVDESTEAVSDDDDAAADDDADNVGDPVAATDANVTETDNTERLTYTLGGPDADKFRVRQPEEGGQIEVGAGTKLDYEKKKSYMVTVTATDPSQASAAIDVTINVTDMNEGPAITQEDDITKEFRENGTGTIQTFGATDPEKRTVYWSLLASDGTAYPADGALTINSKSGTLSFKSPPDYENPPSGITDNSYPVRVVASDDAPDIGETTYTEGANSSFRAFTVTVTNVVEQEKITVTPRFAEVGTALTASLTGGDATSANRGEADWNWSGPGVTDGTAPDAATASIPAPDAAGNIRVEVTYPALGKDRTKTTTISVKTAPEPNVAPAFPNADAARSVDEGRPAGTLVGTFVASDSDSEHRTRLDYSLDATSQANFSISNNGQLKTSAVLDYEAATSHTVTVTATDPSAETGTVEVTVTVNPVNEPPTITGPTRALPKDENTPITEVVAVYTATDPETTTATDLVWKLTGSDAGDFNIGNQTGATAGQLTFKEEPDFEKPAAANNLYRVTVEVSDGKLKATRSMTVMVIDLEEDGEVKLSTVAPKEGVELTAVLTDSDGGDKDVTWQWWKSVSGVATAVPEFLDGDGGPITTDVGWEKIDDAESDTYEPVTDDIGHWLTARASYADRRGTGKTAHKSSDADVIINHDNRGPEFKDANDKELTETTRKVREDAEPNTTDDEELTQGNVGDPVMATDPNTSDLLTYTLGGPDAHLFKITDDTIDGTTITGGGQISLKTADTLDYEVKNTYMVTVTATDPNGLSDSVDVTIMVTGVDEAPKITVGGLAISAGPTNTDHPEGSTAVGTYTVVGAMKDSARWTREGPDAGDFSISNAGVLTFATAPNYEMPMDANTDNTYMVTVKATDSEGNMAMREVTVMVTNMNEMGRVTFWRDGADATEAAITVGDMLTGVVDDSDGNPGDMFPIAMYTRIDAANVTSWQWSKTMTPDMMESWVPITGATDAAYTVVDDDDGHHLQATAMYADGEGMGKMASEETMMVMMMTMNASPMFDSETDTREVAENTAAGMDIGAPVTAADADADTLTYTLGGTDAASFDIGSATGQLMTKAALDYEMPRGAEMSDTNTNDYMVTVTATDPEGASDMITVTITVTNVDEEMTLFAKYDDDKNGEISQDEVIQAINDYLFGEGDEAITKDEAIEVINFYLFPSTDG